MPGVVCPVLQPAGRVLCLFFILSKFFSYSPPTNLTDSAKIMARPRPRSTSNVSITNNPRSRPPTTSPQLRRTYAMASDSIYQNNMTVLRRRDPSISSILDSFSHVCLYHFNGVDWEKRGFEGTMFLVEQ